MITLLPLCLDGIGVLVCPEIFLYPYKASGRLDERNVLILPHTGEEYHAAGLYQLSARQNTSLLQQRSLSECCKKSSNSLL